MRSGTVDHTIRGQGSGESAQTPLARKDFVLMIPLGTNDLIFYSKKVMICLPPPAEINSAPPQDPEVAVCSGPPAGFRTSIHYS